MNRMLGVCLFTIGQRHFLVSQLVRGGAVDFPSVPQVNTDRPVAHRKPATVRLSSQTASQAIRVVRWKTMERNKTSYAQICGRLVPLNWVMKIPETA